MIIYIQILVGAWFCAYPQIIHVFADRTAILINNTEKCPQPGIVETSQVQFWIMYIFLIWAEYAH